MKRFITIMFSFLIMFFGGMAISSNHAFAEGENLFEIDSPEKYVQVMSDDNAYLENAKVVLKADIDLQSYQELGNVYATNRVFKGVFDGNGYTISNIKISGYGSYFGLIPHAEKATIQNLRIQKNVGDANLQDAYVGIVVGYGKDVTIKNCELDGEGETGGNNNEATRLTVTIPTKSNVYFGSIVGKLSGGLTYSTECTSQVYDCVNYYNFSLEMGKKGYIYAGGMVGEIDNASLVRVINFGNLSFKGMTIAENNTYQYLGGIAGSVSGTKSTIKNSLNGGGITLTSTASLNNLYKGGILGGNPNNTASSNNFNYDYYTNNTLTPSGDNFLAQSTYLCLKGNCLRYEFLDDTANFDGAIAPWDFERTWSLNLHLQNFQTFSYVLNKIIDRGGIFEKAYFVYNGLNSDAVGGEQDRDSVEIKAKYDSLVTICLEMKEDYKGWYILKESGVHLNTINSVSNEITLSESETGLYNITFKANLVTSGDDYQGTYTFTADAIRYEGVVSLSPDALKGNQGVYKIDGGRPGTEEYQLQFSYKSRSVRLTAEGNEQFTFDHWEILYKNTQGVYSAENKYEEDIGDAELAITYGEAPFDKAFKCVAYFTDSGAIKVSFGNVGTGEKTGIKSIKFSGKDYDGVNVKEILVSPNNTAITLQVVTEKGYKVNVDEFKKDIAELYGGNNIFNVDENSITIDDETGETTYNFSLDMSIISTNASLENNSLKLSFVIEQENGGSGNSLLWLYITIPVVVALIAGIVVFILIMRRRKMAALDDNNTSGGTSAKQKESKPKKENYKNYY